MADAPLLVIAAGGTGGHMFPAQALAEEMLARGWRVRLATDARGARFADEFPGPVERRITASASFAQGASLQRATAPFAVAAGAVASIAGDAARPAGLRGGLRRLPGAAGDDRGTGAQGPVPDPRAERRARPGEPRASPPGWTWSPAAPGRPSCRRARAACTPATRCARRCWRTTARTYVEPGDWPMGLLVIGGSQGAGLFARRGARGAAAAGARAARAAAAGAAGAGGGHGPGAGGLCRPRGRRGAARVLRRPARPAGRGDAGDQPGRRELARRHHRDRPAGDPGALSARGGRPPGRERPRAGFCRRRLYDPRGGVDGGGAGGAHHRDSRRTPRGRRRWRTRACRRAARTPPIISRRWSRTSPQPGRTA